MVLFRSTNGGAKGVALGDALLAGQAPDRGLFLPEEIPSLERADLERLTGASYPEVAYAVLRRYTAGQLADDELRALCDDAYDFDVPVEAVGNGRYVLRLDRGPTASFKDFAARAMARLIPRLLGPDEPPLVILTATSGDTGSAVAQAFAGIERIYVVILYPEAEVSDRQRKQMTTLGGNVRTLSVDGKFDDCQAMVKRAFSDDALRGVRLTSANSINIGRLLPQSVYYVYAYTRVADVAAGERVVFCVPSGNFGNLCGGLLAKRAGLPVARFVVATNANDAVPVFFDTERYAKIDPSRMCLSNAMNVGHPSNLARLVDLYGGHMDETGLIHRLPDMAAIRRDLWAVSVDDEATRAAIKAAWTREQCLLEPHGAVGWSALDRFAASGEAGADLKAITLETAHPAKFPDEVRAATGIEPEVPESLARIETLAENTEQVAADYDAFRDWLLRVHG